MIDIVKRTGGTVQNQSHEGYTWDRFWDQISNIQDHSNPQTNNDLWTKIHLQKIEKILSSLHRESVFLEAGCGLGQWCFYSAQKHGLKSIGEDIASNTISRLN